MLEDLGFALLLVVVGLGCRRRASGSWWPARKPGGDLALPGLKDELKDLGRKQRWAPALAHPASRASILLVGCVVLIWLSHVTVLGWTKMSTFAPDFRETGRCWALQRWEAEHGDILSAWAQGQLVGNALPKGAKTCPVGGRYLLDKQGYITCTRHGRPPDAQNVIPPDLWNRKGTAK